MNRFLFLFYQNKLQFVDQDTRKTFPWSIKAPAEKFDQQLSLDPNGDKSFCIMPYTYKARNYVKTFKPGEIENRFTHADFTTQQLGIYSQKECTNSIDKMKFNQLGDDAAEVA